MKNKKALYSADSVIESYIALKRKEKSAADDVSSLKPLFAEAMRIYPNGLEIAGAVIFSRECKKYAYSRAILAAEKRLAALKSAFEKKNKPSEVITSWAVKL